MRPPVRPLARRVLARAKRTRAADAARRVRRFVARPPRLSVVVPFHDAVSTLPACLDSLLEQTYANVAVILVDDGSGDGSRELAESYVRRFRNVSLVVQPHAGVGGARNAGARRADGTFLAFCDADDVVPPDAYSRMVRALRASGSDLCIGAPTLQQQGRHQQPAWARRSNPGRALGVRLEDRPEIMANLLPGTRVFRRSFWDRHQLSFSTSRFSDVVTMVQALLLADRIDILPAVTYRWHWRSDGRSLVQRTMVDRSLAVDRLARLHEAAAAVVRGASEEVQWAFFAEVLHATVPDLVRAAVTRTDGYWEAISPPLRAMWEVIPAAALARAPVEHRIVTWLCVHDLREAAERFLEYAFDNQTGLPCEVVEGHPRMRLPDIPELAGVPQALLPVAETEMVFRTRLISLRWLDEHRLQVEGAAIIDFVDDAYAESEIAVVLRDVASGEEWRLTTEPAPDLGVNQWAQRGNEDHTAGGFRCVVDGDRLPLPDAGRRELSVDVELRVGRHLRRGAFQTRQQNGSAGLVERRVVGDHVVVPVWRPFVGLKLRLRRSTALDQREPAEPHGPLVETVTATVEGLLHLAGRGGGDEGLELALVGPRSRTPWVAAVRDGDLFEVDLPTYVDEWAVAPAPLPSDRYELLARTGGADARPVAVARQLWRTLPAPVAHDDLVFAPMVTEGMLAIGIQPREWQASRPPYLRRQLRDVTYAEAREQPLLDAVLFETFAGKAAGDNPGALCRELSGRDEDLELFFSVTDRSVLVPDGAQPVVRFSEQYFSLLGRARYLIVNAALPYSFRKRDGQLYFQTWHGTPLKRIAHDRPHLDFFNWHHRRQLLIARSQWDYLLSQSEFCSRSLSSAFRYEGPVMEQGYPRNDVLSSPLAGSVRERTRERLGIDQDSFVVLYAPTWRDNLRVGRVFDKVLYLDPHRMVERMPGATVLVRGHYNSVKAAEGDKDPSRHVLDVTRYPDIADLYLAADALVTDYSSVYFDFAITDKPMIFLAPDLQQYRDDNRGFYLDYESTVPGPICLSTDEVIDRLTGSDDFAERRRDFRAEFAPHDDGKASARVIDEILRHHPYR